MKKYIIGITLLLIAVIFLGFLTKNSVPKDLSKAEVDASLNSEINSQELESNSDQKINLKNPKLTLTGYGPANKSHKLIFNDVKYGDLIIDEQNNPKNLNVEIELASLDTGIESLNKHMCSEDFFDCVKFPTANFNLVKVESVQENVFKVYGELKFRGVNKNVNFDVSKNENVYSSSFLISASEFGINYAGVDDSVKVDFSFEL